ncbi:hypothetical protein [Singulisphaera acidiphila]|uniref:Uncharacterized protein n=1 Tax=Singulisphaera acidiphila (strain ATCC BAA-1392 / DSM 18658 / VKM B-2454 / MOB10) TaxID=886293 RepID=L0D9G5_SINAD|nr:hypothetical protein [Singulisphaera acidiphila]AGA25510.1 hypothetical protein Sinac_1114 [Singulisphaera acidiphila DSM 18658]
MRIGNRLGGSVLWSIVVMISAPWALGAVATERVAQVPLGGSLSGQSGDRQFGVYVPTSFGGQLTLATNSGTIGKITGPDGKERRNGQEVGMNQQGWYSFEVTGAEKPYRVETSFVQVGQSDRKVWNFYYWPTKSDAIHEPWAGGNGRVDTMRAYGDDEMVATPGGYIAPGQDIVRAGPNGILETPVAAGDDSTWFPNQYDDLTFRGADGTIYATPAPMLKYDQLFNSSARSWEAANSQNHDIQRWPGHCLGGAVASILLSEPNPAPGSGLTKDELKALWAELGENHLNHQIGEYANEMPAGPPRPGYDPCDSSTAKFHNMIETHIRGNRKALLANLRAFPPRGTVNEVWNHGVGKYTATYHAIPGKGPRAVRLEVALEGNSGSSLNGQDDKPRVCNYEYTLVYGLDGRVDLNNIAGNDWISVGGEAQYAPLNILQVTLTRWAGHNPYVTEANVRSLDLSNGGGVGRTFAGAPPQFRPVGNYEAGRPAIASNRAGDINSANGDTSSLQPRRGLFRMFGR